MFQNWKEKAEQLDKRCSALWNALQRETARSGRLKNEIEMLIVVGKEYGVTLTPNWIERLEQVLAAESQAEGF